MHKEFDVLIIGAGAAGIMAAISAAQREKTVLLLEKNSQIGKKILISGGGRCNFTNLHVDEHDFVSSTPRFCTPALKSFTNDQFIAWIKESNIPYFEKELGQLFCLKSSRHILDMLGKKLDHPLITVQTDAEVHAVAHHIHDPVFVATLNNRTLAARNLVIASGGLSYPQLGVSDLGYRLAKQFGHSVTSLDPALVGLVWPASHQKFFSSLSGVSVTLSADAEGKRFTNGALFTHDGISGPAILNASLYWRAGKEISLDFLPHIPDFQMWFKEVRGTQTRKKISSMLSQHLPSSLVSALFDFANIEDKKTAETSRHEAQKIEETFKRFKFTPHATRGFDKAEVTRGGVATEQISRKTMESKLIKGLFFVGEVVDVTGRLGGYNLQWAWSSGWLAGQGVS